MLGRASTDVGAARAAEAHSTEVNDHLSSLNRIVVDYVSDNGDLDRLADTLKIGAEQRPFDLSIDSLYLALIDDSPAKARIASDAWEAEADRLEAEAA